MTATPLALVAAFALATPAVAAGVASFRTPGRAAYCGVSEGELPVALICWTPNDGFTTEMYARGRVGAHGNYHFNFGYHQRVRTLGFGHVWHFVQGFRCRSRRTGLTCINRDGHGWWLGRYKGYRIF